MEFPKARIVTSASVRRAGGSQRSLNREYESGALVRLMRGVYVDTDAWLAATPWGRYALTTAGLALAEHRYVFCRETALALMGLPLTSVPERVHVLVGHPARVGARRGTVSYAAPERALLRWRGLASSGDQERSMAARLPSGFPVTGHLPDGPGRTHVDAGAHGVRLRCTDLEATLGDTLAELRLDAAAVVLDAVLVGAVPLGGGTVTRDRLVELARAQASQAATRRVLAAVRFADPASESAGESRSRAVIHQLGFEAPRLQHEVWDARGLVGRVDFWWPGSRVVGEFDGRLKYSRSRELSGMDAADVVVEEKLREDRLRSAGCGVVRWDWSDLEDPARVAAKLEAAGIPRFRRKKPREVDISPAN